jgi:hypothetical protein
LQPCLDKLPQCSRLDHEDICRKKTITVLKPPSRLPLGIAGADLLIPVVSNISSQLTI